MIIKITKHFWRKIALYLVNKIFAGTNPLFFNIKRKLLLSIGFIIGNRTKVVGPVICTGHLSVGEDCWIGANFAVRGNGYVILGNRIDVGPDVTFLTGTHAIGNKTRRAGEGYNCKMTIGDGCWVGGKSVFVNNIEIGESSVIAAKSCVCKNVPANVVVGGVPSKVIKHLE